MMFYYVMDTMYIYSWKKKLTCFGDPNFFFIACGVQLDNGVDPPRIWSMKTLKWHSHKIFSKIHITRPFKYMPQMCIYTNNSFISLDEPGIGNITMASTPSWTKYYNHNMFVTKQHSHNVFILANNLNNIYLIDNHISAPPPSNQLDKLLVEAPVDQIVWSTHKITIQKVRARSGIIRDINANHLANDGSTLNKPSPTPHTRTMHTTPYWLDGFCYHLRSSHGKQLWY
jgi:hypothetical protein